jgi:hypothetical protein
MTKKKIQPPANNVTLPIRRREWSAPVDSGIIPRSDKVDEAEPYPDAPPPPLGFLDRFGPQRIPSHYEPSGPAAPAWPGDDNFRFLGPQELLAKRDEKVVLNVKAALQGFQDDLLIELTERPERPDFEYIFDLTCPDDVIALAVGEVKRTGWECTYDEGERKLTVILPRVKLVGGLDKITMAPQKGL